MKINFEEIRKQNWDEGENREFLELKRKQFEKSKAEFDITNMCICASIIEKLENEIKEVENG